MKRTALQSLLSLAVAGAIAAFVFVLFAQTRQRSDTFAAQVAAGAQKLFASGQRKEAIGALEELLATNRESIIARRELAMELLDDGQWQAAADQLRLVLKAVPTDAGAAAKLAEALDKLGDLQAATDYAHRACRLDPENGLRWITLSALLFRAGDADGALRAGKRAVRYAAGVPDAHLALGFAQWLSGDTAAAAKSLSDALALDPSNPTAQDALARLRAYPHRPPPSPPS
ncbi:MAG: tetratricopeptide repeat protein, partial [Armatimonadota bacterium]